MDTVVDIAIAKEGKEALAERWLGVNYILEISTNARSAVAIALVLWISRRLAKIGFKSTTSLEFASPLS